MNDSYKNKIKSIEIENFTCFEQVKIDFSSGVNVIIGENGTGKTHLLKLLYSTFKHRINPKIYDYSSKTVNYSSSSVRKLFKEYFVVTNPSNLIRRNSSDIRNHSSGVIVSVDNFLNSYYLQKGTMESEINMSNVVEKFVYDNLNKNMDSIYIHPQEMLSWQEGFLALYEKREVTFDKTYKDLALALDAGLLKNSYLAEAQKLVRSLENVINGKITRKDRKFYFIFDEYKYKDEIESSIVATGINKIGQLIYLILNGSITKESILFWDEPEASLNPKYISIVSKFLQTLANWGVQIFVATHDYLLVHQLSLAAEYRNDNTPDMRFFALYKTQRNGTKVEFGETLTSIQNDAILDEFAKHYDVEESLFSAQLNEENENYGKED